MEKWLNCLIISYITEKRASKRCSLYISYIIYIVLTNINFYINHINPDYIWFALKVPSVDILGLNTCSTLGNDIPKVSRSTSSTVSTVKIVN